MGCFRRNSNNVYEPRHEKTCLREFPIRSDSNWPAQLQKLAWGFNFWLRKLETLHYLGSEQQRRWSDCANAQADLRLCCSHMTWHVFSWPGSYACLYVTAIPDFWKIGKLVWSADIFFLHIFIHRSNLLNNFGAGIFTKFYSQSAPVTVCTGLGSIPILPYTDKSMYANYLYTCTNTIPCMVIDPPVEIKSESG